MLFETGSMKDDISNYDKYKRSESKIGFNELLGVNRV